MSRKPPVSGNQAPSSSSSKGSTVLAANDIHKRFGGVHALRGANLKVQAGEVHGLLGENGSGKSTLLSILSGQLRPDAGQILLDGVEVTSLNSTQALEQGIATVTQERALAPDLTVAENIFLGHRMARTKWGMGIDWKITRRNTQMVLERLDLDLDPTTLIRSLRPDQQQMVEIARAISGEARVLILDEPTSSLTDDEVDALGQVVRHLKTEGVATIFVSHRLSETFALVDRVTVLRDGATVDSGLVDEHDQSSLIRSMVGRNLEESSVEKRNPSSADSALRVRNLSLPGYLANVNLEIFTGEIVGLAGLVGAGRSELLESLFGLHSNVEGEIEIGGQQVHCDSPRKAINNGLAFLPADRKRNGLVSSMSVQENLMMSCTSHIWRLNIPDSSKELSTVQRAIEDLDIRAESHRAAISTLSGGNQQKVVLAKSLLVDPLVLMLDEPTRGVDVGAKREIYEILTSAAADGLSMLISSSEPSELLTLCDRILVMFRGEVVASLNKEDASEALITHFASGYQT